MCEVFINLELLNRETVLVWLKLLGKVRKLPHVLVIQVVRSEIRLRRGSLSHLDGSIDLRVFSYLGESPLDDCLLDHFAAEIEVVLAGKVRQIIYHALS